MKRMICSILCLCLIASLLSACGHKTESATSGSTASQQLCHSLDYRFDTCDSVEYSMFVLNTDLPESFISYNMLRSLGFFRRFIQNSPEWGTGYDALEYYFVDQNDIEAHLSIRPLELGLELEANENYQKTLEKVLGPEYAVYERIEEVSIPQNLRWLGYEPETTRRREYIVDGISYIYSSSDGGLHSIEWVYNGIEFMYYVSDVKNYPAGPYTDTFAAKLLNVETARAAVDELMASCFPED